MHFKVEFYLTKSAINDYKDFFIINTTLQALRSSSFSTSVSRIKTFFPFLERFVFLRYDRSHRCISSVQNQYSSTDCYLYGGIVFRLKSFSLDIILRERLAGVAVQRPSNVGKGYKGAQLKGRGRRRKRRITRSVSGASKLGNAKAGERGLFDKCEMYHSSLLWSPAIHYLRRFL